MILKDHAKTSVTSVMRRASSGLHESSQRRGVMPLVMLMNLPGYISAKSLKLVWQWWESGVGKKRSYVFFNF